MKFSEYQLNRHLLEALVSFEIETPSAIQAEVFEDIKNGNDVMGVSATGSGKTLAYLLPVFQSHLDKEERGDVLILEPTRELVQQVTEVSDKLLAKLPFNLVKICGGEPLQWPENENSNCVVATPGRLLKGIDEKEIDLSHIKAVIIDEADQFFQQGFIDVLQDLLSQLKSEYQSLMFSATMPSKLEKFSQQFLMHPKVVNLSSKQQLVEQVEHTMQLLMPNRKLEAFKKHVESFPDTQVLVFCNTKFIAERLYKQLDFSEKKLDWLHGDLEQTDRNRVFDAFKKGDIKTLITTDVAARGLDIKNLDLVLSYDFPLSKEAFVHRAGRTGRMGRAGTVVTFVRIEELESCKEVLDQLKLKPNWVGSEPDFEQVKAMKYKAEKKHRGPASPRKKRRR